MTERKFLNDQISISNADCLKFFKSVDDNSIDLIVTDPPYFQVKSNAWDNQWPDAESFLAWLDEVLSECWRVLKPSGSLYLFCGHRLAPDTELLMRQRFNVLNHIIWVKNSGPWNKANKESLRAYFPASERILFAEHYGADGYAKGCAGYASKCADLRKDVFKPLIDYFRSAREALGVSAKEINAATGTQMCSHWFSYSQWRLPSRENYEKLQALFELKAGSLNRSHDELMQEYETLDKNYQALIRQYDDLKSEYERLRRPFSVTKEVPFTDIWRFKKVEYYPGKHPCEKPADMLEHIITASSRPGDVVLDVFMGSGSTGKAALKLGRRFIGVELEQETFESTSASFEKLEKTEWIQN